MHVGLRGAMVLQGENLIDQNYKISVALCTFNGGNFIGLQLESILNQSRPPDEVIICDDASADDTIAILRRVAAGRSSTVRIIQNEKKLGCVKNFEKAIKLTTGDIIFLSDQDDVWFKEKIASVLIAFGESDNIGLVYSDAILTNAALEATGCTLFGRRKKMHLSGKRLPHQLMRGVGINGCTMAFRSCLKDFILPISETEGWGHDHWIAFIAHAVMDNRSIDKPLMYYRRHGHNSGNDPFLDGGWLTNLRGLATEGTTAYARDLYRWEVMLMRLDKIEKSQSLLLEYRARLNIFKGECEQRIKFARLREHIKQAGRMKRIMPLVHALLKGNYHRYLHGIKSFFKDLLIL
jgi:glycosyltransferase involved in cell wall biosynthesis